MITFDLLKTLGSSKFETRLHLKGVIDAGDIVAIHGISGAGKTTFLKMLAGLIKPDQGEVVVEGSKWFCSKDNLNVNTRKRSIGFIFQDYALFPNMNVLQNVTYGLKDDTEDEFLDRIIHITRIRNLLEMKPENLSGGQKQRVAFARAVVRKPKLLLLDEPLSALDVELRAVLQNELLQIRKLLDLTIVFTSHSVPEVYKLADKVMLLCEGKITKVGSPAEVFAHGDEEVSAIGEFLSLQTSGAVNTMNILVDGKIVSVDVSESKLS